MFLQKIKILVEYNQLVRILIWFKRLRFNMSLQLSGCSAPHKEDPQYMHVVIGAVIVIVLVFVLQDFLNDATLLSLIVFNMIFLFLTFPLRGPLWCKIVWLMLGNAVGVLFGIIRLSFSFALRNDFQGIDFFLNLIIDFLWIVPIWSLALSFLGMMKHRKNGVENPK